VTQKGVSRNVSAWHRHRHVSVSGEGFFELLLALDPRNALEGAVRAGSTVPHLAGRSQPGCPPQLPEPSSGCFPSPAALTAWRAANEERRGWQVIVEIL